MFKSYAPGKKSEDRWTESQITMCICLPLVISKMECNFANSVSHIYNFIGIICSEFPLDDLKMAEWRELLLPIEPNQSTGGFNKRPPDFIQTGFKDIIKLTLELAKL